MQNLNILAEYKRASQIPQTITVDEADAVIKFCANYDTEVVFLHKDGEIQQYFKRTYKDETVCDFS